LVYDCSSVDVQHYNYVVHYDDYELYEYDECDESDVVGDDFIADEYDIDGDDDSSVGNSWIARSVVELFVAFRFSCLSGG